MASRKLVTQGDLGGVASVGACTHWHTGCQEDCKGRMLWGLFSLFRTRQMAISMINVDWSDQRTARTIYCTVCIVTMLHLTRPFSRATRIHMSHSTGVRRRHEDDRHDGGNSERNDLVSEFHHHYLNRVISGSMFVMSRLTKRQKQRDLVLSREKHGEDLEECRGGRRLTREKYNMFRRLWGVSKRTLR